MTYSLKLTNGTFLVDVPDETIDKTATPLALVGRGAVNYGKDNAENFIKLAENFAHSAAPSAPLKGMLWYDTTNKVLKLYNGTAWVGAGSNPGQPFAVYATPDTNSLYERAATRNTARFVADGGWQHVTIESYADWNTFNPDQADGQANNKGPAQVLAFYSARGSEAAKTAIKAGDTIGHLNGFGYDGAEGYRSVGLSYGATEDFTTAAHGTSLQLFATQNGQTDAKIVWHYDPAFDHVYGGAHVAPYSDNVWACGTAANRWSYLSAASSTIVTSDLRLKTEVKDSALGLDFINALRPVSYKFIEGGKVPSDYDYETHLPKKVTSKPGTRTHWGLIAQEVKNAVDAAGVDFAGWTLADKNDPESTQSLRYEEFVAPLIKAVQELAAKVAALEAKLGQ